MVKLSLSAIVAGLFVACVSASTVPAKKAPLGTLTTQVFAAQRKTITTKQSYNTTNSLLQTALKYSTWDPCTLYGPAQPAANAAVATGNVTAFVNAVDTRTGPYDFMLFDALSFAPYLALYLPKASIPQISTYIIGNPIIAETMFAHDWLAGLHVPVRVVVVETFSSTGTDGGATITWDLPSSLIAIGAPKSAKQEAELKAAAVALDQKLEVMLRAVTGIGAA